jgi:hypothetical protein
MYRGSGPRIFPIIIIILVVAFVIAGLVSLGRVFLTGNSSTTKTTDSTESVLTSVKNTENGRSVSWTVRGPIVADEQFRSYQITISPSERKFVTYSGYLDQVIDSKSFTNNQKAYEQFVYALDKAGIGETHNVDDTDFRGVCATDGFAYIFNTYIGDSADHTLWTSSCKGSKGTMGANVTQVHALFVNQIPGFKPLFTQIY